VGASAGFGQVNGEYGDSVGSAALLGTLIAAKQFGSHVRVGLFTQFGSIDDDTDEVDVTFRLPMLGAFIGFSEQPDGQGVQARVSAAYEQGKVDYSRVALLGPSSDVKSNGEFETYGFYGEMGWGYAFENGMLLTPFVALAASEATRDAYKEGGADGFSYDDFSVSQVTGIVGLRLKGMFAEDFGYRFGAAIEHDFSYDVDTFKVSGDDFGTSSYDSDYGPSDWRMSGTAGVSYFLSPTEEFMLDGYVSQFSDDDSLNFAISAGFRLGF
jgi:outer membrane autotransporter protein